MSHTLLCVQFRNLLPSEDLLLLARSLWKAAHRDRWGAVLARDATLSITKTDCKVAPFEASLALAEGSLRSIASGFDPLAAIEAAFAQVRPKTTVRAPCAVNLLSETTSGEPSGGTASASHTRRYA